MDTNNNAKQLETRSGAVIFDNEPYYYVDEINGSEGPMIIAYDLSKHSIDEYQRSRNPDVLTKAAQGRYMDSYQVDPRSSSKLAQHLVKKFGEHNRDRKVHLFYKAALFTAPEHYGVDTATKSYVLGFNEMAKQQIQGPINGHYPPMQPTGVFIGLNHVHWIKDGYDFRKFDGYDIPLYENYMNYFRTLGDLSG